MKTEVRAYRDPGRRCYGLYGWRFNPNCPGEGAVEFDQLLEVEHKPYDISKGPFVQLEKDEAQELFDSLWTLGFRPEHCEDQSAVVKAKDEHIAHLYEFASALMAKGKR